MRNLFTIAILFFLSLSVFAQPTIDWQSCLGGTQTDVLRDIQVTSDGGFILAASSRSSDGNVSINQGEFDFWIIKLSSTGAIEWEKSFGGSDFDQSTAIQQTIDGGYIVTGSTKSNDGDVTGHHGNSDAWVLKLTSSGAIEWQRSLGGSLDEEMNSVQQTSDGGYILAGRTNSNDGDVIDNINGFINSDIWVVKLTSTGVISWQRFLGGTSAEYGSSIQETFDGGFILGGSTNSDNCDVTENNGSFDYWIVKLSETGSIVWEKCFGGSSNDYLLSTQQTSDGGYILGGQSTSYDGDVTNNNGSTDFWIIKLTCLGILEWEKTLGGTHHDTRARVQQTSEGGYIVSGNSRSNNGDVTGNSGYVDIWLVKLTNKGRVSWQKSIGGASNDYFPSGSGQHGIKQVNDGGFIISGSTESVSGDVAGNHGGIDCWIVKLSAFELEDNIEPKLSAFPNPANDILNLDIAEELIGLDYTIHDYTGRIVSTGKVEKHCNIADLSSLSIGVYVVLISTDEDNFITRFVKS